jgi:hypothetical protein
MMNKLCKSVCAAVGVLTLALGGSALAQDGSTAATPSAGGGGRAGSFGLRANFIGNSLDPTAGNNLIAIVPGGLMTPMVGARFFATDQVAINAMLGLGMAFTGATTAVGFGIGGGVDFFLRTSGSLRPFVGGELRFAKTVATVDQFGLTFAAGGGAEYWFSDNFSLDGRALIAVPVAFNVGTLFMTVTPAVGANFYF